MPDHAGTVDLEDGGRLAFEITGRGPALLLCRWATGSMAMWHELVELLATKHRVIAFDPRGAGRSSNAPLRTTTRGMARDAVDLLDALAVPRADLFGESLGGMTASWIAIDAPERVRRLVLASTLPELTALSWRAVADTFDYARCLLRPLPEAAVCVVQQILAPGFARAHPARMAAIEDALRAAPARRRNHLALALAATRHRAASRLRGAPAPTLLLFGDRDPLVGPASRRELCRERPSATVAMIEGAGHALTLERPAEVAREVLAFLE